jgi:prepilin-type N-terminal cleavage/methylation domain-containing protein
MTSAQSRASERGFTLIELLVASIAGLFVVLAAFMLSRGATRMFSSEGRVANSQLNLRFGIDRLRQDLDRAGYMTTANGRLDPDVCPDRTTSSPQMRLQSIFYQAGASALLSPLSASNGLNPDSITLTGNFASTDSYLAALIEPSLTGAGHTITLQQAFGSTARLLGSETGDQAAALSSVFAPGRLLRIRNGLGSSQFVVITNTAIGAGNRPQINIEAAPPYTVVEGSAATTRCGGQGLCIGCEINPVQIIRYEVRSLASNPNFLWAYSDSGAAGEADKYDLVRTELNPQGEVIAGTEEIVAEYAVDLGFAFAVDTTPPMQAGGVWTEPVVESFPFGHPNNAAWAGDILNSVNARPQRIRSVRYRFTTRTRFADYDTPGEDSGPGLARYQLAAGRFARARTVTGDIALTNQQGIRW